MDHYLTEATALRSVNNTQAGQIARLQIELATRARERESLLLSIETLKRSRARARAGIVVLSVLVVLARVVTLILGV